MPSLPRELKGSNSGWRQESLPVVALCTRDLFFSMRIQNGLERLQLWPVEVQSILELERAHPVLAIIELEVGRVLALPLLTRARELGIPSLAFGAHRDTLLWAEARAAGAEKIVAKSALVRQFNRLVLTLLDRDNEDNSQSSTFKREDDDGSNHIHSV